MVMKRPEEIGMKNIKQGKKNPTRFLWQKKKIQSKQLRMRHRNFVNDKFYFLFLIVICVSAIAAWAMTAHALITSQFGEAYAVKKMAEAIFMIRETMTCPGANLSLISLWKRESEITINFLFLTLIAKICSMEVSLRWKMDRSLYEVSGQLGRLVWSTF